jgi:proline iminopeptidase
MDVEEGFISVDGGRIWYRCVGRDGIPLLVLHGGPGAGHD